jgi:hypothetical protein
MAGAGYKLFNTGDVLTAAQVNTYLQEQTVMVFANATARTTALSGVLAEGMMSYLQDTNAVEVYNGSAWVAVGNTGDITGVTAGTGISGGGTSGTVTITNDMATTITAAGDIVVGTGSGTYDNLPIGTTGQVLTADTTVSPYKVKWATAASSTPSFVGCMAVASANTSVGNSVDTAVAFGGTDLYDTDGFHDPSVNNSRITIPTGKGGKYQFQTMIRWDGNSSGARSIKFYINGTEGQTIYRAPAFTAGAVINTISFMLTLNAGDYVQIYVNQTSGGTVEVENSGSSTQLGAGLRFGCQYLGA